MSDQAQRAYEAWRKSLAGISPSLDASSWETLNDRWKEAWRAAVVAAIDTPDAPQGESLTALQMRLLDESETVRAGKALKSILSPDRGFILFTFNFGPGGNIAYISSAARPDAIRALREWLRKERAL
jgi:hypothetical protein